MSWFSRKHTDEIAKERLKLILVQDRSLLSPSVLNELKEDILKDYFDLIIFKDLVQRFKIENINALKYLTKYIATNISEIISIKKIFNDLKSSGVYFEGLFFKKQCCISFFCFISNSHNSRIVCVREEYLLLGKTLQSFFSLNNFIT